MKKAAVLLITVITGIALAGCATTKALSKDVWKDPSMKIGVAVVKFPAAGAHKTGAQGLLDAVINEALSGDLKKALADTDMSAFLQAREKMAAKITDGGLQAVIIEDLVDTSALPKKKGSKSGSIGIDFSSFKEKHGVDYLLLLNVQAVGTSRNYYGFIPMGSPKGFCFGNGVLVKIDDGTKQWDYTNNYKKAMVDIEGKWDVPPEYANLKAAVQKAITNSADDLVKNFK